MRIAIIGAGNVGGTLGAGWLRAGHEVAFGVRDQSDPKLQQLVKSGAKAGTVQEAAKSAEVIVLATPWEAVEDALKGAGDLKGKVVTECTNPLKPDLSGLALGTTTSGAEEVARWAKGAGVVKAFNTTGFGNMANPRYPEGSATMFNCGDDTQAKAAARQLAADLGFDPIDAGPLSEARQLEAMALLWIHLARRGLGMNIAFRLMRR
jgi:8-hydroxy-5-deazaflavin:NADPH oxidoreductase